MLFDLLAEKPGLGSHLSQHSLSEEKMSTSEIFGLHLVVTISTSFVM